MDKILEELKEEIYEVLLKEVAEPILDFAEIAITSPETYEVYRSKILRLCNNAVRKLHRKIPAAEKNNAELDQLDYTHITTPTITNIGKE